MLFVISSEGAGSMTLLLVWANWLKFEITLSQKANLGKNIDVSFHI